MAWEEQPSIGSFFRTFGQVLFRPRVAFRAMQTTGNLGYSVSHCGLNVFFGMGSFLALNVFVFAMVAPPARRMEAVLDVSLRLLEFLAFASLILPLLFAVVFHFTLLCVGGAKLRFGATYRALAYATGVTMVPMAATSVVNPWLILVPVIGKLIGTVVMLWVFAEALAATHGIKIGRSWLAVLLGLVVNVGFLVAVTVVSRAMR